MAFLQSFSSSLEMFGIHWFKNLEITNVIDIIEQSSGCCLNMSVAFPFIDNAVCYVSVLLGKALKFVFRGYLVQLKKTTKNIKIIYPVSLPFSLKNSFIM